MAQGEVTGGKGTTWLALSIGDFAYKNNRKTVRGFKETESPEKIRLIKRPQFCQSVENRFRVGKRGSWEMFGKTGPSFRRGDDGGLGWQGGSRGVHLEKGFRRDRI